MVRLFNNRIKNSLLRSLWMKKIKIGEYLAKLQARTRLSRALCTPGQHTAKRRIKCTRQPRSLHQRWIVHQCSIYPANSHTYYYQFSITHSLFRSRLKTFLFCKSFPLQPFLFFFRTDYMIPQTFTVTSEHIRFYFLVFCTFLNFLVVGSVR